MVNPYFQFNASARRLSETLQVHTKGRGRSRLSGGVRTRCWSLLEKLKGRLHVSTDGATGPLAVVDVRGAHDKTKTCEPLTLM